MLQGLFAVGSMQRVYVTLFPCNECAKLLIQAGIKEIVYHEDKLAPQRSTSPSKDGFRYAHLQL